MSDAEVLSDVQSSLQALLPGTWRQPLAHAVTRWGQVGWVGWLGWLGGRVHVSPLQLPPLEPHLS